MSDVCGKSNGKWFGNKICSLELNHYGWCSWETGPSYDNNHHCYIPGACKYNHIAAIFAAAGFDLEQDHGGPCHRCEDDLTLFVKYAVSVAPSGYQKRKPRNSPRVCLRCEEVGNPQGKVIGSITEYLTPFLAENKSASNNAIILQAIEKMQADIVRLRSCLEPELAAGKGAYRSLPQGEPA